MDNPKISQRKFIAREITVIEFEKPMQIQMWNKGSIGCDSLLITNDDGEHLFAIPTWKWLLDQITYITYHSEIEHKLVYEDHGKMSRRGAILSLARCSCGSKIKSSTSLIAPFYVNDCVDSGKRVTL